MRSGTGLRLKKHRINGYITQVNFSGNENLPGMVTWGTFTWEISYRVMYLDNHSEMGKFWDLDQVWYFRKFVLVFPGIISVLIWYRWGSDLVLISGIWTRFGISSIRNTENRHPCLNGTDNNHTTTATTNGNDEYNKQQRQQYTWTWLAQADYYAHMRTWKISENETSRENSQNGTSTPCTRAYQSLPPPPLPLPCTQAYQY